MIDVRSSTCQYHDNLAIFNTIQSNNRYEKIYAPRRNIGTSRLLLSNVPEITEHEDTTDNCPIADTVFRRNKLRRTSMTKKFMNKRRGNQIRWKDNLSSCSIDSVSNANVSVRLRGGTDFFRTPMKTKICNSNNCCVFHSTRTQKPIIPREQTRIVYRNLQNFVDGKETKTLPRQFTRFQKEKQNVEQSKTLKSVDTKRCYFNKANRHWLSEHNINSCGKMFYVADALFSTHRSHWNHTFGYMQDNNVCTLRTGL